MEADFESTSIAAFRSLAIGLLALLAGACGARESAPPGPPSSGPPSSGPPSSGPTPVVLATSDGGTIHGDLYGAGERGIVLTHGGRFDKQSWAPQARALAADGRRVLAIDFRGYGSSRGPGDGDPLSAPLELDVLAAVHFLRDGGAREVAVVGGSMGASAAGDAAIAERGAIDRLVLLAGVPRGDGGLLGGRKLFLVARDDPGPGGRPRLEAIRACFERAPEPKELVVLEGAAHAQFLFDSDQGPRTMDEILRFLREP